jgi:Protein of unknown function (DUF4435)
LARLRLDRKARRTGVVIVEGPTDERVLSTVFALDRRRLFPVRGRVNLLRCAGSLDEKSMTGVVCVADRDFDSADAQWKESSTVVFYDGADLEAMIVESEALDRVLEEWASKRKLERLGGSSGVRTLLRERAQPLAVLRSASARENLGLCFSELPIQDIVEKSQARIKNASLVSRLAKAGPRRDRLEGLLAEDEPECPDTHQPLRRGKDLMSLLATMFRQMIGSLSRQQVRGDFVERTMRLALAPGDFDNTPFNARFRYALEKAQEER